MLPSSGQQYTRNTPSPAFTGKVRTQTFTRRLVIRPLTRHHFYNAMTIGVCCIRRINPKFLFERKEIHDHLF